MTATTELRAAGITDATLADSYRRCRRLNAAHGKTYFLATLLLPPAKRPYVHALYGFARHADDMIDVRADAQRFTDFSATFLADLDRGASADPVSRAVLHTIARWQLPHRHFTDFLDSMRMDLTVCRYETYQDLAGYMWGSAGVIGLQMLPILGRVSPSVPWSELEPRAVDLGMAFQLTNFLRDVAEDLHRGRVYLPQDSLRQHGLDEQQLRTAAANGLVSAPIRALLAAEIDRARGLYRSAQAGVELVHPTSQDCLRTALRLYGEILDRIEANGYDVFSGRVAVGLGRRARVGLGGLAGSLRARRQCRAAEVPAGQ
jgi:phytoene synthase